MAKLKKRTTIYLDDNLAKQLKIFAASRDVNTSKLISDIMSQFLDTSDNADRIIWAGSYPVGGYKDESIH